MAPHNLPPIPERVTKGAALLDRLTPGWAHLVDLEIHDEKGSAGCVLAQVYGGWVQGWDQLLEQVADLDHVAHGFDRTMLEDPGVYQELTAAWQVEITRRTTPTTPEGKG